MRAYLSNLGAELLPWLLVAFALGFVSEMLWEVLVWLL